MKILGVRFQNLNSLKGEHEIRFDQPPLSDAGLFAITGPTGAGKTTILDAITAGLYGMVHRHNNDRPLDLMTRHTAESYAEVEFEAGGRRFRSKWGLRRSRGKAEGKLQPIHMELCDLDQDQLYDLKPSEVPDKVAEVSGLDYSQFLRSVMLSQGDFARFLKAKDNERSSLLEKITDTGVYSDISRYAFEKARAERHKAEELERQLKAHHLLPEEERQAFQTTLQELEEQHTALKREEETLKQHLHWLHQLGLLQERETRLRQDLVCLQEEQEHLQPDFRRLERHEQARRYQQQLTEITYTGSTVQAITLRLAELEKSIPTLEGALEQFQTSAQKTQREQEAQEEALRDLEPVLEQVLKADSELASHRNQFSRDRQAYQELEKTLAQEEKELLQHQTHLLHITQQGQRLAGWLKDNKHDQELREHLAAFRDMLRDLKEVEAHLFRLQKEKQEKQLLLADERKKQLGFQEQEKGLRQKLTEVQENRQGKLSQLQTLLAGQEVEALEKAAVSLPDRLYRLSRQHELALHFGRQEQERRALTLRREQTEAALAETTTAFATRLQEHRQANEHLQALQKIVEQQARIQELEASRHLLQRGQACPLCGSEHHPFVESHYVSRLSKEETKRAAQQSRVEQLQAEVGQLQVRQSTLQGQINADGEHLRRLRQELDQLVKAFSSLNSELGAEHQITEPDQLAHQVEAQRQSQTDLQHTLAQVRGLNREKEALGLQQQQGREALLKLESQLEQSTVQSQALNRRLLELEEEEQDLTEQRQGHTGLAASFASGYGAAFCPEKRAEVLQALEKRSEQYQEVERQKAELREPYFQANGEVQRLEKQTQKCREQLRQRKEILQRDHEHLQKLKEARQALFGEQDPQAVRQAYQQALKQKTTAAEEARTALLRKEQELQEQRRRRKECQSEHHKSASLLEELRLSLLQALQPEGIETVEALSQMLLDQDEATRLTNLQRQTQNRLIELRTSLTDVQKQLLETTALALTALPENELREHLQRTTGKLDEVLMKRGRLQQQLEQDVRKREEHQEIAGQLHTQQQAHRRWEALSSLIGSADGNKFSRFAQGLTLARLVELANHHLRKLNDRYRILKNPEQDLELLILDTYQAEAVRPMNTLSGGESFLVSLALALGLSDLAGRRTQIKSLFIDEGFGTLDADTLDTAISTLENLQTDGKMIGIISHVEALKERIATQIRVRRLAGGVSKVEVTA